MNYPFDVYATATTARSGEAHNATTLEDVAKNAEKCGFTGLLSFYNNRDLNPWQVASAVLERTGRLVPLVAVQPFAAPPFTVAHMIHSLTALYGRRVDLNLITGASAAELAQAGDPLGHDERYERAKEFITVVRALLGSAEPLRHEGRHYRYAGLRTHAPLDPSLMPRVFVAGSSEQALATAHTVADVAVTHPEPVERFTRDYAAALAGGPRLAVRVELIARPTTDEAWAAARNRYVTDRAAHVRTAMRRRSESDWSRKLAHLATDGDVYDGVYWTGGYRSGKGYAPQLVGDYASVARYLSRYIDAGVSTVLLGNIMEDEEFAHAEATFAALSTMLPTAPPGVAG
ncbi:LLM class flavin-dependent oxidoreductase [Streptomyces phaeochromogenes]